MGQNQHIMERQILRNQQQTEMRTLGQMHGSFIQHQREGEMVVQQALKKQKKKKDARKHKREKKVKKSERKAKRAAKRANETKTNFDNAVKKVLDTVKEKRRKQKIAEILRKSESEDTSGD